MALKQKLAELIVDITARLDPLKGHLTKAKAVLKRGLASMVKMARRAGKWIGVGLVAALAWATRAAMQQEEAEMDLAVALRLTGDATKENIARFKKFASEMQKVTKHGDEFTLGLMAQLKFLGVRTDRLKEATRMVIGLSAATGRDTSTMVMATAAVMEGSTELLQRYIPALRTTTDATEKMRLVMAFAADGFLIAKDRAKTTRGALVQMWNMIGDIAEKITAPLLPKLRKVATAIKNWAIENEKLITAKFGEWLDTTGKAVVILAKGVSTVAKHWKAFLAVIGVGVIAKLVTVVASVTHALSALALVSVMTVKALAVAAAVLIAKLVAIAAGIIFIVVQLARWTAALKKLFKAQRELNKKDTIDERVAAYKKEHGAAIKAAKARHAATRAQAKADKDELKVRKELSKVSVSADQLRAQRDYYEKVGGYARKLADIKRKLLAIEARETAKEAALDEYQVRRELTDKVRALQLEAAEAQHQERLDEYKERLGMLRDLFANAKGFESELADVKKKLRYEEALDIARKTGISLSAAQAILAAKDAAAASPAEAAKVGLASFQSTWGQIATSAKRVDEQQLAVQKKIQEELQAIKEQGQKANGIQSMTVPRF